MRTLALLLAVALLTGCAGFRSVTRGAFNSERTGAPAPALDGGTWLAEAPFVDGPRDWTVVAFVKPG